MKAEAAVSARREISAENTPPQAPPRLQRTLRVNLKLPKRPEVPEEEEGEDVQMAVDEEPQVSDAYFWLISDA